MDTNVTKTAILLLLEAKAAPAPCLHEWGLPNV